MEKSTELGWLPVNGQDLFNYAARYTVSNHQINAVLAFTGHIEEAVMEQAVYASLEAEPILRHRFIEEKHHPYWEEMELDKAHKVFLFIEAEDGEKAAEAFTVEPIDSQHDLRIKVQLIRTLDYDVLCIKIDHACCDVGAVKEYLTLLAELYNHLLAEPEYKPVTKRSGSRDQRNLFLELGITDPRMVWDAEMAAIQPAWAFPSRSVHLDQEERGLPKIAVRRFTADVFHRMRMYGKSKGATINDLLLTAYFRALWCATRPQEGLQTEVMVTVDLRRYLPGQKTEALCNLSGAVYAHIMASEQESFEETLEQTIATMQKQKENRPGLHTAAAFEMMNGMPYEDFLQLIQGLHQKSVVEQKASPLLSNIGEVCASLLYFGKQKVKSTWIVTPAHVAPGIMLGASSYEGTLTLIVNYYPSVTCTEEVDALLDRMSAELSSLHS